MEYISAEEFRKQPKEVQKVFLEWWKPKFGDFLQYKHLFCVVDCRCGEAIKLFNENYTVFKKECIPLLTESQIRKFIEDTRNQCEIRVKKEQGLYSVWLTFMTEPMYRKHDKDLLQAYWKVAYEIAKESI